MKLLKRRTVAKTSAAAGKLFQALINYPIGKYHICSSFAVISARETYFYT